MVPPRCRLCGCRLVLLLMLTGLTAITMKHTSKTSPFRAFGVLAIFVQQGRSSHRAIYLSTILAARFRPIGLRMCIVPLMLQIGCEWKRRPYQRKISQRGLQSKGCSNCFVKQTLGKIWRIDLTELRCDTIIISR